MGRICKRAVRIGLPAVVFTEHLDFEDVWRADDGDIGEHAQKYIDETGYVRLPAFDLDGYLSAIEGVRRRYPDLRVLTGVEGSSGHDDRTEPTTLYRYRPADEVMRAYLEEVPRMVAGSDSFAVFTHIDYAVRSWPVATAGPFGPREFEEDSAWRCAPSRSPAARSR